mmetsp:Transcript_21014/g.46679  ORF Transcript_21014/g.46679 Transcript_21014/m.46679 type:complete len:875 (+) Transcript_21014:83-2707(+)
MSELIHTIYSDDEVEVDEEDEAEVIAKVKKGAKRSRGKTGFSLDFDNGRFAANGDSDEDSTGEGEDDEEDEDEEDGDDEEEEEEEKDDLENVRIMPRAEERIARAASKTLAAKTLKGDGTTTAPIVTASKKAAKKESKKAGKVSKRDETEVPQELSAREEAAYFESVIDVPAYPSSSANSGRVGEDGQGVILFSQLSLSRPLLRAVERTGYVSATPIQAQTIPHALAGKDICASAETGSGKTAAFVLPFLERLLFRPRDVASIRVLVITPTRELALQIHQVLEKLAQFTDVTSVLICGGKKDVRSQEVTLRSRPDIVICTPGRMLDHLRNSRSVSLDDLDVLVLDEADRLLEMGFQEEVEELVRYCPVARQTMLFSATMTSTVENLVKMSLKRPVRVRITGENCADGEDGSGGISFAPRLVQEFVRVRAPSGKTEGVDQEVVDAMMLALVCRSFGKRTIVFFEMKRTAHRFCALLTLLNVKAAELHGDVSQAQRYLALERFRNEQVDILVATDVAARGLDIPGVLTVINAEMPRNLSMYVHRVGRTARAGRGGRAITLVSDSRRKMMKEVLKMKGSGVSKEGAAGGQVLSRTIPALVLNSYIVKMRGMEGDLKDLMRRERERAHIDELQMEAEKAENLLVHEDEIGARPIRTWYQSEWQKNDLKEKSKAQATLEEEEALIGKAAAASKRTAKERATALAMTDDYPLDDVKTDKHKMSRKKRRRLEALKDEEGDGDEDEQEDGKKSGKSAASIEAAPRRGKMNLRKKEGEKNEVLLSNLGMKRVTLEAEGGVKMQKVVRQSFAVGGLDQDFVDWGMGANGSSKTAGGSQGGMTKGQIRQAARDKPFTDFDSTKQLRKGGKVGNKSFKSKSKFKRR